MVHQNPNLKESSYILIIEVFQMFNKRIVFILFLVMILLHVPIRLNHEGVILDV